MANPIQHAKQSLEENHAMIQPYLPDVFVRLATNYGILALTILFINLVVMPLLLRFTPIPISTINIIAFSIMLLTLVYGWRFLEKRNQATALFVVYTRYIRQRRDLDSSITIAENDTLEDENTLYVLVDLYEESAGILQQALDEANAKIHSND